MRIVALAVPLLALLTWASWPAPFAPLDPEDGEAIRLLRDLERGRPGAWEAIVRARNSRTVPALMALESEETLGELLHPNCCGRGGQPHPPADAFESALQAIRPDAWGCDELKRRGCAGCPRSPLEEKLDDPDPGVRFAAAAQLWRSGNASLAPRLIGLLGEHSFSRYPWLSPVAELLRPELAEGGILAAVREGHPRGLASAAFLKMKPAVEDLVRLLNDPLRKGRWPDVAWTLGEIGDPRAVGPLIQALGRGEYFLTGDAAEALAKIGDRSALPALREALDEAGVYGQAAILRALGQMGEVEDISRVECYAVSDEYTGAIGRRRVAEAALKKLRP